MSSAASSNATPPNGAAPQPLDVRRTLYSLPLRVSAETFLSETTSNERDILRFELNCALQHFLEFDRPIFLEGLGIVFPSAVERMRGYPHNDLLVVRREMIRRISFEKCEDVVALNGASFPNMVQTRELAQRVYPRLPMGFHLAWSEQGMRSLLRGYILHVRENLIQRGFSNELSAFGTIYALHNRQGQVAADRFAGADIVLHPRKAQVLRVLESKVFERPVMAHAHEPLEAAHGPAKAIATIDFQRILKDMDLVPPETATCASQFEVGAFVLQEGAANPQWLLCTNGMRHLSQSSGRSPRTELTVQLPRAEAPSASDLLQPDSIALRILALGWLLLCSSKTKTLKAGVGLNIGAPLATAKPSQLHAILTTRTRPLFGPYLAEDGEYNYINLVGISEQEAELVARNRKLQLLALLDVKRLDQVTYPSRGNLLDSTTIE